MEGGREVYKPQSAEGVNEDEEERDGADGDDDGEDGGDDGEDGDDNGEDGENIFSSGSLLFRGEVKMEAGE